MNTNVMTCDGTVHGYHPDLRLAVGTPYCLDELRVFDTKLVSAPVTCHACMTVVALTSGIVPPHWV